VFLVSTDRHCQASVEVDARRRKVAFMRRFLIVLLAPAVFLVLALAVVAACDGDSDNDTSAPSSTTSTTAASTTTQAESEAADDTSPPDEPDSDCAEGGTDEAIELQSAFEEGHQPWRGSPESVAEAGAACALDTPGTIEPAGTNRYRATDSSTGESVIVEVAQPLGPGTVWLVTAVVDA
jgi:hypothetical protein